MPNLTITIDEATLKKARLKALSEGVSVDELLRRYLESYVGMAVEQATALDDLMALSRLARSRHTLATRWSREELRA